MRAWLFVAALALGACDKRPPEFHGVVLGLAPRDVRERFDVKGAFEVVPAARRAGAGPSAGEDFTMKLTPSPPSTVTAARFEFHGGILVAVRADVTPADADSRGAAFEVSKFSVLHRVREASGTHVNLVARDCPTHRAEAEELVREAR